MLRFTFRMIALVQHKESLQGQINDQLRDVARIQGQRSSAGIRSTAVREVRRRQIREMDLT